VIFGEWFVSLYSTEKHFIRTPVVEKQMYFPLQNYPVNNMVTGNLK
jgi:hypothetical protein